MQFHDYGPMHPTEAAVCLLLALTSYSAWLTHIVDCAGDRLWGFLVGGAIVFPVGIVHGAGVWLGLCRNRFISAFSRRRLAGRLLLSNRPLASSWAWPNYARQ